MDGFGVPRSVDNTFFYISRNKIVQLFLALETSYLKTFIKANKYQLLAVSTQKYLYWPPKLHINQYQSPHLATSPHPNN